MNFQISYTSKPSRARQGRLCSSGDEEGSRCLNLCPVRAVSKMEQKYNNIDLCVRRLLRAFARDMSLARVSVRISAVSEEPLVAVVHIVMTGASQGSELQTTAINPSSFAPPSCKCYLLSATCEHKCTASD